MKVLITPRSFALDGAAGRFLQDKGFTLLPNPYGRPMSAAELIPLVGDIDAAIAGLDEWSSDVIAAAPRLRVIARNGVGRENVDEVSTATRGIRVATTPGANKGAVAELALALMLALARRIIVADKAVKAGNFPRVSGMSLEGKTFGIIGLGNIGRELIKRLSGFSPVVLGFDPYAQPVEAYGVPIENVPLEELLARSDVVSLHLPENEETRNMMNAARLKLMKPGALLINCARGGLIDEAALYDALASGALGGAGLDAFAHEPPAGSPLLGLDNVIALPHCGAATAEVAERVSMMCAEAVWEACRT